MSDDALEPVKCPGCGASFVPGQQLASVSGDDLPPHASEDENVDHDDANDEAEQSEQRREVRRRNRYYNR